MARKNRIQTPTSHPILLLKNNWTH
jgi:hypothetical protein